MTSYVSDQYQQGILIGYIASIEENSNNLTKSGTITPVVDFEHIENVLVILQVKDTGDDKSSANSESSDDTQKDTQKESSTQKSTESDSQQ